MSSPHVPVADRDDAARPGAEGLLTSVLRRERGSLLDMLRARAGRHPETTFLSWRDGADPPRAWSYGEAWIEVCRCAAGWRAVGVGPGHRVASFASNHPRVIWAWFGATAAGATYIPLNRHLQGPLLADQLQRSHASFVVTELDALQALEAVDAGQTPVLVDEQVPAGRLSIAALCAHEPGPVEELDPAAIGYITFTSGSTGRSKAVRLPNNSLVRGGCAYAAALGLGREDVILGWNPLFHWGGMVLYALGAGCEYALYPRFSASRFWEQAVECGATFVEAFPAVLDYLLNQPPSPAEREHRLELMLIGGYDEAAWSRARERFGVRLTNAFGMSEAEAVLLPDATTPQGWCGRPAPGWEVALRDDRGHTLQGPGRGELLIRPTVPDVMFAGYEDDAGATVDAWRDLWLHTGDLFDRDADGHHHFLGRAAHRIRRRGENVSEEELNALLKSHPQVAAAAVVAVRSDKGEDDIKAALVPRGEPFDLRSYIAWCRTSLPRHMMPRYFETMSELPELQSAKIDIARLRELSTGTVDAEA